MTHLRLLFLLLARFRGGGAPTPPPPPPPPPVTDFTGTPLSGTAPLDMVFTDASTNSPNAWAWDFGDGGTSNVQNPTHTYIDPGSYTVSLTAFNDGGSDNETKAGYVTVSGAAPRLSISGKDFIGEDGNVFVPYGLTDGHFELWRAGDEVADAAMGANCLVEVVRIYGTYGTGYQQDMQQEGQPGDLKPAYLSALVSRMTSAKAAGMYVGVRMDSDKGQGSEASGGDDYFSGSTEGLRKWGIHKGTAVYLATNYPDLIDWMEPLVEPNSAVVATKEILWAKQEEFMTAVLAVAPRMLFAIGPRDYSAGNIANAINPAWLLPASPFYGHVFMTCNFLDNLSMNPTQRAARVALVASTRNTQNVPAWIDQIATHNSNDPDNSNLDATMTLLDQAAGGPIGYTYWERVSMADTADGLYYLTNQADPNSARGSHAARIDLCTAHFTQNFGNSTWSERKLLGVNLDVPSDASQSYIFRNQALSVRAFCPLTDNSGFGVSNVALQTSGADKGYPVNGTTFVCVFAASINDDLTGLWKCSVKGNNPPQLYGGGSIMNVVYNAGTNRTTWDFTCAGAGDSNLAFRFNNVTGFGDMQFMQSGYLVDDPEIFTTKEVSRRAHFKVLRTMDAQATNEIDETTWTGSTAASDDTPLGYRKSLKCATDMASAIGAIPWVCTQIRGDSTYITQFVSRLKALVSGPAVVEPGNEPWNLGFNAFWRNINSVRTEHGVISGCTDGRMVAGLRIVSASRSGGKVTINLSGAHGKTVGQTIYSHVDANGVIGHGVQTLVTGTTGSTLVFDQACGNATADVNPSYFNAWIFLNPDDPMLSPVSGVYGQPTARCDPIEATMRYLLTKAKAYADEFAAQGVSDRFCVRIGAQLEGGLHNIFAATIWAREYYGGLDWLYANGGGWSPAYYMVPTDGEADGITSVNDVFTVLETDRIRIATALTKMVNMFKAVGQESIAFYEGGPHNHRKATTAIAGYVRSAHLDDRMRVLVKNLYQDAVNRLGENQGAFCYFHDGKTATFDGVTFGFDGNNNTWALIEDQSAIADTSQPKYVAQVELKDVAVAPVGVTGVTQGTILLKNVLEADDTFGVYTSGNHYIVRSTARTQDFFIKVYCATAGSYTLEVDFGTSQGAGAGNTDWVTALVDGVVQGAANVKLPDSDLVAVPPAALTRTVSIDTPGHHWVQLQIVQPNARVGSIDAYQIKWN